MIHINLNMIFYTYVEHSPTKTIYIKNYLKKRKEKKKLLNSGMTEGPEEYATCVQSNSRVTFLFYSLFVLEVLEAAYDT